MSLTFSGNSDRHTTSGYDELHIDWKPCDIGQLAATSSANVSDVGLFRWWLWIDLWRRDPD